MSTSVNGESAASSSFNISLDVGSESTESSTTAMEERWTKLHQYAKDGDVEHCSEFFKTKQPYHLEAEDAFGRTALQMAATQNNLEFCKLLVENNAQVDHVHSATGENAISLAMKHEFYRLSKYLVHHTKDVNHKFPDDRDLLILAVEYDHPHVVQFLYKNNVHLENTNPEGLTALKMAILKADKIVVKMLLKASGYMLELPTDLFNFLIKAKQLDLVHALMEQKMHYPDEESSDGLGKTESGDTSEPEIFTLNQSTQDMVPKTIHDYAENGLVQELLTMLEQPDITINDLDSSNNTPLLMAIKHDQRLVVDALVKNKCDVNAEDINGYTATMICAKKGLLECFQLLVLAKPDCNVVDENDNTALLIALDRGNFEIANALCGPTGDVNRENKNEESAILIATRNRKANIVINLLKNKAFPDQQNRRGWTSLMIAIDQEDTEIIDLFLQQKKLVFDIKNDFGRNGLMIAATRNSPNLVKAFLEIPQKDKYGNVNLDVPGKLRPGIIDEQDAGGNTALHLAAELGYSEMVEKLLYVEYEAQLDLQNLAGHTPLTRAVLSGSLKTVKLLVYYEANVNLGSKRGNTPIRIAADNNYLEIFKYLFTNGADLSDFIYSYCSDEIRPIIYDYCASVMGAIDQFLPFLPVEGKNTIIEFLFIMTFD